MSKPKLIAIEHDDHHASHIGSLPDGRQFFLTTPFVPAVGSELLVGQGAHRFAIQ